MLRIIFWLLAASQVASQSSFSSSTSSSSSSSSSSTSSSTITTTSTTTSGSSSTTTTSTTYFVTSSSSPSNPGSFCFGKLDYSFPYISGPLPQCLTITQYNYDLPITICGYYKNGVPASLTTQFVIGNSPALTFYSDYPYTTTQYSEAYLQFDLNEFYSRSNRPNGIFISLTKVLGTQSLAFYGSNIKGQLGAFIQLYTGSTDLQQFPLPGFNNYRYISIVGYNGYPLIYDMYTPCPSGIVIPPVPTSSPVSAPTLPPINDIYVCNCPIFYGYSQQCLIGGVTSSCPGGFSCPDCRPPAPTPVPTPIPTKRRPTRKPSRKPTRRPRN